MLVRTYHQHSEIYRRHRTQDVADILLLIRQGAAREADIPTLQTQYHSGKAARTTAIKLK